MGQICFNIDGYLIDVSTHGYFTVYAKAPVPPSQFASGPRGGIYWGSVNELDPDLVYDPEGDDIDFRTPTGEGYSFIFALERPELKAAVKRWLDVHAKEMGDLNEQAQAGWLTFLKLKRTSLTESFANARIQIGEAKARGNA
ncbi:MAG: hypothetical protein WB643_12915 [Candidatus Bathyarchaeia archaeon]